MFRCVAFDAVGTLIEPEPPVAVAYYNAAVHAGSRRSLDEIRRAFREAFAATERADDARDSLATNEEREHWRWREIVASAIPDVEDPESCFRALWDHFASPGSWRCFPDVASALVELRQRGVQIAIASNFDARLNAVCDGLPPLERVRIRAISSEVGYRKPSPHFFAKLVEMTGFQRDEILLVGDDWDNDVLGARSAGLAAAWVCRTKEHESVAGLRTADAWVVHDLQELVAGLPSPDSQGIPSGFESGKRVQGQP